MPIHTERFDFGLEVSSNLEPRVGVEPTTCRWLQKHDVVDSNAFSCAIECHFTWYLEAFVPLLFLNFGVNP